KGISRLLHIIQQSCKGYRAFRYSNRIVATLTVALICLYQISVVILGLGTQATTELNRWIADARLENKSVVLYLLPIECIVTFIDVGEVSFYVSLTISSVMSVVNISEILISYRKNMECLYRGDFSVIPREALQQSAVTVMTTNLHYPGYQIAYLIWSYSIQLCVLFFSCISIAYFIVLPMFGYIPLHRIQIFLAFIITFVIRRMTYMLQKFVSSKWLLQNHYQLNKNSEKEEKVLSLNNRKTYHNMAYFMFFYYIFIALFQSLKRIFLAVFLGVVFYGRIDRSTLMNGFETLDTVEVPIISEESWMDKILQLYCSFGINTDSSG
ncbi:stimulated by retinoic acid gene 6 protein-like, partial [Ylistrum balloti]|uniref:stimulated by retinoic acid gene 6 protein-like n=1 Tax=Ylistrum balloti TaxID=509963 RepID=UPI002905B6A1